MMYYGYFRSIDTHEDPKGQLYKVVILTGLNNGNFPYPRVKDVAASTIDHDVWVPSDGVELRMCADPFIVDYQNDASDVYKPYKCSTASVTFMMDNVIPELFDANGNNVMVALLKRKNGIVLDGNRWKDREGNVLLEKTGVDSLSTWFGFIPWHEDSRLYDVEWIGFATPNQYHQNYTRVSQPFTLECQDALSTLKYHRMSLAEVGEITDMVSYVRRAVGLLGAYKHIYFPSAVRMDDSEDTSSFRRIVFQHRAFLETDDDGNEMTGNVLSVLEALATYTGTTMVAEGDSLYFLQYDAVANGNGYHWHYSMNGDGRGMFFSIPNVAAVWVNRGESLLMRDVSLSGDDFAGADTSVSFGSVSSRVIVSAKGADYSNLVPDMKAVGAIGQYRTYETGARWDTHPYMGPGTTALNISGVQFKSGTLAFPRLGLRMRCKSYQGDILTGHNSSPWINWSTVELGQDDVTVENISNSNIVVAGTAGNMRYSGRGAITGCCILRDALIQGRTGVEYNADYGGYINSHLSSEKYGNTIYFFVNGGHGSYDQWNSNYNYLFNNNSMVQLVVDSTDLIVTRHSLLNIQGNWKFFSHCYPIMLDADNNDRKVDKSKMVITSKVKFVVDGVNYWLHKAGNVYWWSTVEGRCELGLDVLNYDADSPFGQQFSFGNDYPNQDGVVVRLEDHDGNSIIPGDTAKCSLQIQIMRPLGPGRRGTDAKPVFCQSATLDNFSIRVLDERFVSAWGYEVEDSEWKTAKDERVVDDDRNLECGLTSNENTNGSYTLVVRTDSDGSTYAMNLFGNIATGVIGRPEIVRLCGEYNQYSRPTLRIDSTVHHSVGIRPYGRIKWPTQMNDRVFVMDKMSVNYEMNTESISIIEKVVSCDVPSIIVAQRLRDTGGDGFVVNPLYGETVEHQQVSGVAVRDGSVVVTLNPGDRDDSGMRLEPKFENGEIVCAAYSDGVEFEIVDNNLVMRY